ncbi:unnamed protein product [Cercopithifilaria johnstoni]|uniref:Uncharacterized protein n=1 Tax=Cercopithifilaria johnstoni TaxID=2874296 RepID=A0A8J2LLC4_9BILA|nr:unnamed protein product [Cercopithifilaria johnstoni]
MIWKKIKQLPGPNQKQTAQRTNIPGLIDSPVSMVLILRKLGFISGVGTRWLFKQDGIKCRKMDSRSTYEHSSTSTFLCREMAVRFNILNMATQWLLKQDNTNMSGNGLRQDGSNHLLERQCARPMSVLSGLLNRAAIPIPALVLYSSHSLT